MKRSQYLKGLLGLIVLTLPQVSLAQAPEPWAFLNVEFIACVICGVLLALGFQWLLSTLSVAAGVTIAGSAIKKSYNKDDSDTSEKSDSKRSKPGSTGVMISSAVGGWAILTMSLSLFFATLLAVKLSLATSNLAGITLGLVIWSTFLLIMSWMDAKAISNFTGGLIGLLSRGVKASVDTVGNAFGKSEESKFRDTALAMTENIKEGLHYSADKSQESARESTTTFVDEIEKRLKQDWDAQKMESKLDQYIQELRPEPLQVDFHQMRKEVEKLLNEISVEERMDPNFNNKISETFLKVASKEPNVNKEDAKKLASKLKEVKEVHENENSNTKKAAKVFDKITPGSENDAAQFRAKMEEFLSSLEVSALDPNELEHDLDQVINNPKSSKEVLKQRFNEIDHDTIVHALSNKTDMSPEKAHNVIEQVENVINKTKTKLNTDGNGTSSNQELQQKSNDLQTQAADKGNEVKFAAQQKKNELQSQVMDKKDELTRQASSKLDQTLSQFEGRLRSFFDGMNRTEWNYDRIKRDLHELFSKHYTTSNVFKRRAKEYDRDSLVALLAASKKDMSEEDADQLIANIEETRDNVIQKIRDIEAEVKQKARDAKHEMERQGEALRKTTTTAAWMVFAAAAVSGLAAALGGILAFTF